MLWRATLRELQERSDAFAWREHRALEREAILAHWLLSAWVSNAPTPAQLLGDHDPAQSEMALDRLTGAEDVRARSLQALDEAYKRQAPR